MADLYRQKCVACHSGEPSLRETEIYRWHQHIPKWDVKEVDGIKRLVRVFRFGSYADALEFTRRAGELAERENHHPVVLMEHTTVTLHWWTHKVKGLHKNDFIMAAKMDKWRTFFPDA